MTTAAPRKTRDRRLYAAWQAAGILTVMTALTAAVLRAACNVAGTLYSSISISGPEYLGVGCSSAYTVTVTTASSMPAGSTVNVFVERDQASGGDANTLPMTLTVPKVPSTSGSLFQKTFTLTGKTPTSSVDKKMTLVAKLVGGVHVPDAGELAGQDDCVYRHDVVVFKVELITPAGDPVNSPIDDNDGSGVIPDGANEFTFSSSIPGVLTLKLKAKVTPSGVAGIIREQCHFTVGAIGNAALAWNDSNPNGKPIASGNFLEAMVTFTGLPLKNSDFGKKTAAIYFSENICDTNDYEVFWPLIKNESGAINSDGNFAKNHPGGNLAAAAADTGDDRGASERSPNWFYYWKQVAGTEADFALYDSTVPLFLGGETPAVYSFARLGAKGPYNGPHNRILINPNALSPHTIGGVVTTGIDAFRDTVAHENVHAIKQSVDFSNEGLGTHITGDSNTADNHWSFNVEKPDLTPVAPLPAGRNYNHYFNINSDNDFLDTIDENGNGITDDRILESAIAASAGGPRDVNGDGDMTDLIYEKEDLDKNGNCVPDWNEPNTIEGQAVAAEPHIQDGWAGQDWGDPGKNHLTKKFSD